jgi:AraC-like DNA-binding protein
LPVQEQATDNLQNEEDESSIVQTEEQPSEYVKDEWLKKAIEMVEAHLSDEHYNVEQLSADLCMSRMTFYRKIQSATGQKPTEFIRTIRLRRAAELLREGCLTVSEISYHTGFSSVSYFSRCFRTMFGVSPTQFLTT